VRRKHGGDDSPRHRFACHPSLRLRRKEGYFKNMSLRVERGNRMLYRVNKRVVERSIAAVAVTFPWWKVTKTERSEIMSTKKQTTANKSSRQKCFFAAQGPCPAKQSEPRAAIILRYFVRSFPRASAKTCYALATAQTIIVRPPFVRSCSADEKK